VRDGQVVKGVRFRDHQVVGDIMALAARYCRDGADELVFYDITASPEGRSVDRSWINRVAAVLDIPFCVAGGIRSVADAEAVLNEGADKVSVNSPALENPGLVTELAKRFGSQCVVVGIDSREEHGGYRVYRLTGDATRIAAAGRYTFDWIREVQDRGAGEIGTASARAMTVSSSPGPGARASSRSSPPAAPVVDSTFSTSSTVPVSTARSPRACSTAARSRFAI
jgi:cyclase